MVTHNPAFIAMGTGEVRLVAGRAAEPAGETRPSQGA
jgi:hypothetical protein